MLERLTINNIALIHSQTIEFDKGLNVLTGETGAGKSLIIDSLSLLLGEKATKSLISRGEKTASVEAVFSGLNNNVKSIMQEFGLEDDETLIITRRISVDGKNDCRVNGQSFTLSMLKRLSSPLMDLHGQFEHQNLLKINNHLNILDLYGQSEIIEVKKQYQNTYKEYQEIINELNGFTVDDGERLRLTDLYKFQMEEIDNANFYEGEEEELKAFRNQVLHQEKIMQALDTAEKLTNGDGYEFTGISNNIKKIITTLSGVSNYCEDLNSYIERLESVKIEIEDIGECLEEKKDAMYFDEERATMNENRLDLLASFKKKYGPDIKSIIEYRAEIGKLYDDLINSEERVNKLLVKKSQYEEKLIEDAKKLTDVRKKIAVAFEGAVKKELVELGMKSSSFEVNFENLGLDKRTSSGFDKIEFMFSANLGEPVKPLKDVASGGEMSRFMLAIKNITAKIEGISTLVFDEIDTGVSGQIALTIAEKLSKVSKMAQVICVSHLAQIASYGTTHLYIEKNEQDGRTITSVKKLLTKERQYEIARLISGNPTEHSLLHADEMLKSGDNFYKNC